MKKNCPECKTELQFVMFAKIVPDLIWDGDDVVFEVSDQSPMEVVDIRASCPDCNYSLVIGSDQVEETDDN